jgi:hypothetical protein
MTGLDILLAVAGAIVTVCVIAGMVLLTPREVVELSAEETEPQGAELSRAEMGERRTATSAGTSPIP